MDNIGKWGLLVIDMEKAFVEPGAAHCILQAKKTVPNCARVIENARARKIPVFWIKRIYREDGSDVEYTRWKSWNDAGGTLGPNSVGINSIEEPEGLKREPGDFTIIKPRWSGFFQTELDLILRRLGIKNLILIGTTTPNCVRTTCYDGIALDYGVLVVSDCCSSQTEEIQRVNLEDMERIGAKIIKSEDLIEKIGEKR